MNCVVFWKFLLYNWDIISVYVEKVIYRRIYDRFLWLIMVICLINGKIIFLYILNMFISYLILNSY